MRRPCCIVCAHPNHRFLNKAFADPATAPEAGRVASGGREPAQHDPRGRLEATLRGSSAVGASRSGPVGGSLQKYACPRTTLVPRASERAHGAAGRCGPHRSTPWSYGCGEGEAKGSNCCTSAHLLLFVLKCGIAHDLLPPSPTHYAPHYHHTRQASLFWPLQVQVDPDMSSPLRKMQAAVPWASSVVAMATDAASVSHLLVRWANADGEETFLEMLRDCVLERGMA